MKKILLFTAAFIFSAAIAAELNPKPFVIPELTTWKGAEGHFMPSGRIVVTAKELRPAAEAFARDYQTMFGKSLIISSRGTAKKGDFIFKKTRIGGEESYSIQIADVTTINAATNLAAYWATRTLLQISEQTPEKSLPCGFASDEPQYRLRGFMLDCGRKYIPMSYLRELVKVMSYYKMNALQLHLNDNGFPQFFENNWDKTQAAFRLECSTYPGLTAKDGSYTKEEFIQLQHEASALGVEIIPEIDVPAHALAFTHYKPELGSTKYGADHLDISSAETYTFVDNLFKEYLDGEKPVFQGRRVNIGTDEYSNKDQEVVEQFRAFTDHYLRLIKSYGKQPICWGSLSHAKGETPVLVDGVLMACWSHDFAKPLEMKKLGYQLVSIPDGLVYIVPAAGYYYDYLNCEYLYNHWTPADMGRGVVLEDNDPQVEGGMFAVWNDHVGNGISVSDIHHRFFPALQTMATKCWTGKHTNLPYQDFNVQRLLLSEAPGVNELGRMKTARELAELTPNSVLTEARHEGKIGWPYRISFTIQCKKENLGTILLQDADVTVYLSDSTQGRLAFARDGYLNRFNYRLPADGVHSIRIEGTNTTTRLYIDDKLRDELAPIQIYAFDEKERAQFQINETYSPTMYVPSRRNTMFYRRTLLFPMQRTGNFQSRITDFKAEQITP